MCWGYLQEMPGGSTPSKKDRKASKKNKKESAVNGDGSPEVHKEEEEEIKEPDTPPAVGNMPGSWQQIH